MQTQDNIKFFNFIPNIGLGNIKLSYKKNDIIKLLGKPNEVFHDKELEYTNFIYNVNNIELNIFFQYKDKKYDYMSIHVSELFINKNCLFNYTKTKLLKFMERYHKELNVKFEFYFTKDGIEESIEFKNIGLMIWLEKNKVCNFIITQCSQCSRILS
ncbi:MAG: hypothetical protein IPK18_13305 [Sphingobacteriales bacterium]|nr:MAG: hypothetical protein IPK18_13305 [Sphingobacteriales bacterium]